MEDSHFIYNKTIWNPELDESGRLEDPELTDFIHHLCDDVEEAIDYGENLRSDSVYQELQSTMDDLEENDKFSAEEAHEYAWERRKFLLRDIIEVVLSQLEPPDTNQITLT